MKAWRVLPVALIAMLFCTRASAGVEGTPLAQCPDYKGDRYPYVASITWSVNCFLQAIYDKNSSVIVALADAARCIDVVHCINGLDETVVPFIYGPPKYRIKKSAHELITKAEYVLVKFEQHDNATLGVTFIPRPGKSSVKMDEGWTRDFFDCNFAYDDQRAVWVVNGFCSAGGDGTFGIVDEETNKFITEPVIDLTASDAQMPLMIWKPRKK